MAFRKTSICEAIPEEDPDLILAGKLKRKISLQIQIPSVNNQAPDQDFMGR